jgi:Bacterial regulatory proteins, luxR family
VEAGAAGYLLKDASRAELADAVRDAARGKTVLAPTVADRLVHFVRQPTSVTLSAREVEVLSQVAKGSTNAEIGRLLHISEATVKNPSTAGVQQARRLGSHGGTDDRDVARSARLKRQPRRWREAAKRSDHERMAAAAQTRTASVDLDAGKAACPR